MTDDVTLNTLELDKNNTITEPVTFNVTLTAHLSAKGHTWQQNNPYTLLINKV